MGKKKAAYAGLTGRETAVDVYCGIGTIALAVAGEAGKVIGVELNQDAVRDAVANAKSNRITNVDFYHNDAGKFLTQLAEATLFDMFPFTEEIEMAVLLEKGSRKGQVRQ